MEHRLSASELVIDAVATRLGVDPLDLDRPLYDAVDPDQLNALLGGAESPGRSAVEATFDYHGFTVTVDSGGSVRLTE